MAFRAGENDLNGVIERDSSIEVTSFLRIANAITNLVQSKDRDGLLNDEMLLEIETQLAAHFYCQKDPRYKSKSFGKASAGYAGQTGLGFEFTEYGQMAMRLDLTGTLKQMNEDKRRHRVGVYWGGTHKGRGNRDYQDYL